MADENREWCISQENEKVADISEVKFIFEQAEKQLKESVETGNVAVTRTTVILSLIVGFITSLVAFSINKLEGDHYQLSPILITAVATVIYLLFQAFKLKKTFEGNEYYT